jgi:hypothetical protein
MKTRRDFIKGLLLSLTAVFAALFAGSCAKKPDTVTEPSPEWPPKE